MSKMKPKSRFTPLLKQSFVTAAVGCNIIGHGCALGHPAVLLPQLNSPNSSIHLDDDSMSWIVSITGITQLIGSFITPPIMSRYGRRIAHFAVLTPILLGWFITIPATSFMSLFTGRVLQGLSVGMLAPLRSVLIGEYSSPKYRGAFLTTVSLTQSFGLFFVHLIGSFLSWQQTALICSFFSFISLVMTIYSPESPSWLASEGRYEECRDVFRWLRGDDEEKELESMIEVRMLYEKEKVMHQTGRRVNRLDNIMSTIKQKEFYKPITLMMHAYVMVNFAGGTTMATYSTVIIALLMGPDVNVQFWMIFLDTQRLISNFLALFMVNKMKRRTMMFTTGGLSIFSQFALAAYVYCKQKDMLYYDALWIPAILINLKYFTVATGMLPLPNIIGGEVFPLEYRSIGASLSLASLSVTFFLVLKTFPGLVENYGLHGSYIVYGVILTHCMFVIWLLLPETKGKTLQEIEDEFRGRPLAPEELESKLSLHSNFDKDLKRKMSVLSVQIN